MRIRRIYSRLLLIGLLITGMAAVFTTQPAAAQASNLLQNPGFDGEYTPFEGDLVRLVAPGWSAWNVPRKPNEPSFIVVPEYRAVSLPDRTRSNSTAQGLQAFFGGYAGGVLQRVAVTPGTKLKFSAYINVWSSSLDDQAVSEEPSATKLQVGIDPTGGLDGTSANIVWAGVDNIYDQFRQVSVEATANGQAVTVFIKVTLLDPVAHNHAYFDDAELVVVGEAPVPPTAIIEVPTSTATSTNTLIPLPTQAPTLTSVAPTLEPLITLTPSNTAVSSVPTNTTIPSSTPIPGIPTREGNLTPLPPRPTSTITPTLVPGQPTQPAATASSTAVIGATPTLTIFEPVPVDLPDRILVTVAPGDTVSGLAARYGSTVEAITNANGLNNAGLILVGQQLVIPVPKATNVTPLPTFTPFLLVTVTPGGDDNGGGVVPGVTPTSPVSVIPLTGPTVNGIGTYIVQAGDNFEAIAQRYNVTVRTLAALNGILNPKAIVIGQVLAVPGPGNNVPGGTRAPTIIPTVPAPAVRSYVVQPGDTLYRISIQFGVSTDSIMRLNNIGNPNLIYVGQTLRIP